MNIFKIVGKWENMAKLVDLRVILIALQFQTVAGSISGQGTYLDCGFNSWLGLLKETASWCFCFSRSCSSSTPPKSTYCQVRILKKRKDCYKILANLPLLGTDKILPPLFFTFGGSIFCISYRKKILPQMNKNLWLFWASDIRAFQKILTPTNY